MLLRERQRAVQRMFAGTAVKITVKLDDIADSVTLIIFDPTLGLAVGTTSGGVVLGVNMVQTSANIWTYVWQSPWNAVEGDYVVDVYINKNSYQSVDEMKFVLIQQEGLVNH